MGARLQRHLGPIATMDPGQWTSDPARHRTGTMITVFVGCPACGGVHELEAHRVQQGGAVLGAWTCPTATCSFQEFIDLEGWGEPAFNTSDINPTS